MSDNCLIVIDMQNDFLDRLGDGRRTALIENTNRLIDCFRQSGCPVVWVKQVLSSDFSDAPLNIKDRRIPVVLDGTPGADIDRDLACDDSDIVVIKKRYSAFFRSNLEQILTDIAPEQITLAGINTHACVRATAIDAFQLDMRVLLATDCLASHDPAHGQISVAYMDGNIALAKDNAQLAELIREAV